MLALSECAFALRPYFYTSVYNLFKECLQFMGYLTEVKKWQRDKRNICFSQILNPKRKTDFRDDLLHQGKSENSYLNFNILIVTLNLVLYVNQLIT